MIDQPVHAGGLINVILPFMDKLAFMPIYDLRRSSFKLFIYKCTTMTEVVAIESLGSQALSINAVWLCIKKKIKQVKTKENENLRHSSS